LFSFPAGTSVNGFQQESAAFDKPDIKNNPELPLWMSSCGEMESVSSYWWYVSRDNPREIPNWKDRCLSPQYLQLPLVQSKPSSESSNIETICNRLQSGRIIIPDYQRDAGQWDLRKESLFIESILNNLTIPAFFFADRPDGEIEVVDGQQRLTTIFNYVKDKFALSVEEDVVYLSPQSLRYRGKKFNELPGSLKAVFNDYPLTIINLPSNLDLSTKLEIFRRINEGGMPLTGQDIRLSYYSDSKSVFFLKLAGIHGITDSAKRMIDSGAEKGIDNPWSTHPEANILWQDWWEGKELAKGQTPSEMFL
jgi:Protein of unknown function DUF262